MTTVHDAITACLAEWHKPEGRCDFGNWRDQLDQFVEEACTEFATTHLPVTDSMTFSWDYEHGGWFVEEAGLKGRDATLDWLKQRGFNATPEDSGDLYRIYVEDIGGYFWPEDEQGWWDAV